MVDLRMILDTYVFFVKNEHIQVERLGKYSLNRASGKHAYELCFFLVGERLRRANSPQAEFRKLWRTSHEICYKVCLTNLAGKRCKNL